MFGDYQCPPCRAEWPAVVALAAAHPRGFSVYFRNFPLTEIHPDAFAAATAAEVAKLSGRFQVAHSLLYAEPLPTTDYSAFYKAVGIRDAVVRGLENEAKKEVADDLNKAISMGLRGTPAFFLIDDLNSVYAIESLEDLRPLLVNVS